MNFQPINQLQRKMARPSLPEAFVPRPRLDARLTEGMSQRVILVMGPAGYGKSCLVSHWLEKTGIRACWLNLDDADNQLATFLSLLVRATRTHYPQALSTTQLILQLPEPPPHSFTEATLINELADLPDSLVIVLENYHLIHDPEVTRLVQLLIDYQPDTIRLVILARGEPQLPLLRLRTRKQIAEIGPAELAFSSDEAQAYLNLILGAELDPAISTPLIERTEGWIMGLSLAAEAVAKELARHDADSLPDTIAQENDEWYEEYFAQGIIAAASPAIRRFLLVSAIPRVFSVSLCDALLAEAGVERPSSSALEHLRRHSAFLFPCPGRPGWYRYHQLFRDTLLRLSEEEFSHQTIAGLHELASRWLAENGYIEEALEHALAADKPEMAARIVEEHAPGAFQREELGALSEWLQRLPPDLIQRHPSLLLAQAWCLQLAEHRAPVEQLLTAAETLLKESAASERDALPGALHGEILALRSSFHYWHNRRSHARDLAEKALIQLPADHPARYHALCYRALARQAPGDHGEAAAELEALIKSKIGDGSANLSPLLLAEAHLALFDARPEQVRIAAQNLDGYGSRLQLPEATAWSRYFFGRLHYEQNYLDVAETDFSALLAGDPPFSRDIHGDSLLALALISQENGEIEGVLAAIDALEALGGVHKLQAGAVRARQALRLGEIEAAEYWMETTPLPEAAAFLFTVESPLLTQIRVLLALNTRERALEAIRLLQPTLQAAQLARNTLYLVKVLALRALALSTLGRRETALEVLGRAIRSSRGAMTRTFVDLGSPMAELLYEIMQKQNDPQSDAAHLLEAFASRTRSIHPLVTAANERLVEPLTERELEILGMLYRRLSNMEIARTLHISPLTVKKHTINIYQKLNVQSRREAVATGSRLGLIFEIGQT